MSSFKDFYDRDHPYLKKKFIKPDHVAINFTNQFIEVVKSINLSKDIEETDFPIRAWSNQFMKLLASLKQDRTRLSKVLNWYKENWKRRYSPKAHTAEDFRFKFSKIEEAMERWNLENPDIPVEKYYHEINLKHFAVDEYMAGKGHWGPLMLRNFPLALQLTHYNYIKFSNYIFSKKSLTIYSEYLLDPEEFLLDWWKGLDQWFLFSDHRKINPLTLVFEIGTEKANRWMHEWWEKERNFSPGTADDLTKGYLSSKFNTKTYTKQELKIKRPYQELMYAN